jgi:hypothetical protein
MAAVPAGILAAIGVVAGLDSTPRVTFTVSLTSGDSPTSQDTTLPGVYTTSRTRQGAEAIYTCAPRVGTTVPVGTYLFAAHDTYKRQHGHRSGRRITARGGRWSVLSSGIRPLPPGRVTGGVVAS